MLPNTSRIFTKVGYDHTVTVNGPRSLVEIYRCSLGFNWNF